jgi:hypothetical protein
MASIKLKGREIPLLYTTYEMKQIQEEIAPIGRAFKIILGHNPDDEKDTSKYGGPEQIGAAAKMIRILGNAGLEESGEKPDLTEKQIMRAMKPSNLMEAINACMNAITEGMASEIPEKEEEGPVDVTLEEMKKKEVKEG